MAALTATSTITTNCGANTLLIVTLTAQGASDTYTLYAGAPILAVWVSGTNAGASATFVQSTGVITIVNTTGTGAQQLFILLAGC
jgi:hypothetical protein